MSQPLRAQLSQMMSDLKAGIMKLSSTLKQNTEIYAKALREIDQLDEKTSQKLFSEMKANDLSIHSLGDSLEAETVKILSLQAPVSRDLRTVLSSFRIIYDIQRIARDIVHSFEGLTIYAKENSANFKTHSEVFMDSINATKEMINIFEEIYQTEVRERDFDYQDYVEKTENLDDIIDELFEVHSKKVIEETKDGKVDPEAVHRLLASIRSLERVGDHCCNIVERSIYIISGDKIVIQ